MNKVNIEYCRGWGYGSHFQKVSDALKGMQGVEVTGVKGRSNSFEVTMNGELIYSKLKTGNFPSPAEIAHKVQSKMKR